MTEFQEDLVEMEKQISRYESLVKGAKKIGPETWRLFTCKDDGRGHYDCEDGRRFKAETKSQALEELKFESY